MLHIYNKNPIYKYKQPKIFINKKGVTFWITPFYLFMLNVFFEPYFTSSKSTSVTLSSLPPSLPWFCEPC